jgi:hypothetical protein
MRERYQAAPAQFCHAIATRHDDRDEREQFEVSAYWKVQRELFDLLAGYCEPDVKRSETFMTFARQIAHQRVTGGKHAIPLDLAAAYLRHLADLEWTEGKRAREQRELDGFSKWIATRSPASSPSARLASTALQTA